MYLITILLTTATGLVTMLIARLVARLVARRATWTRAGYATAFIVGALIYWLLLDDSITPRIYSRRYADTSVVEGELRSMPEYRLLERYDAPKARAVRDRFGLILADPFHTASQLDSAARALDAELFITYIPNASDSSVVAFLRSQLRIIKALRERDTAACYAFLHGGAVDADRLQGLVGPTLLADDSIAMAHIIASGITSRRAYDSSRASQLLAMVYDTLRGRYPDSGILLSDTLSARRSMARYCAIYEALYITTLSLPHPDAARVARRLVVGR